MKRKFNISTKKDLELFISKDNFKKIFVLAGPTLFKLSGLESFFKIISKEKKIKYFFKKKSIPEYSELIAIIKEMENFSPDLIIAAGGGSIIDYGKIANVLQNEKYLDRKIINSEYKLKKSLSKLLVIPTTAGSGAEVTSNAVIYIKKIKYSVEGELIKPDFFFLIPDFINGSSNAIKSSAGFDAISQAIESLISKKSNDESVGYAKKSLEISLEYFLKFLKNPSYENICAMSIAANLSGKAINISETTAPHAVSYPFTSFFKINHGHAVALTLNKFIKFNFKNIKDANCNFNLNDRYKILFEITKTKNIEDLDLYIEKIKYVAELETSFDKLGIDIKSTMPRILSGINNQRLLNNPVKIDTETIKKVLLTH
jgi:alcohol dehydrogenase class IV